MPKIFVLVALAGTLTLAACGSAPIAPDPELTTETTEATEPAKPTPDYWQEALDMGYAAAVAAGEAAAAADWKAVRGQWDDAVQLLYKVPEADPNYAAAQEKKPEYQANREAAHAKYEAALNAWVPDGFTKRAAESGLSGETEVAYRWSEQYRCTYGDFCLSMDIVPRDGCENSLYVELSMLTKDGTNVGMVNDSTSQIKPGEQAQLVFQSFNKEATTGRISEMNCY